MYMVFCTILIKDNNVTAGKSAEKNRLSFYCFIRSATLCDIDAPQSDCYHLSHFAVVELVNWTGLGPALGLENDGLMLTQNYFFIYCAQVDLNFLIKAILYLFIYY